jgi:uncharacterized protein GlcG (DUF336 family)
MRRDGRACSSSAFWEFQRKIELSAENAAIGANSSKTGQALQASGLTYPEPQPEAPVRATDRYRPRPGVLSVMMTMEKAQKIIEAAIVKAKEIGQPMNIAVVDAWLGSIDIAINKAFTAKAFDISTLELGRNSQPGNQFFGIHASNHARVMIFAGGVPIKMRGQIVGAVGVSGGSGEQDQAVAEAAVAAWS